MKINKLYSEIYKIDIYYIRIIILNKIKIIFVDCKCITLKNPNLHKKPKKITLYEP